MTRTSRLMPWAAKNARAGGEEAVVGGAGAWGRCGVWSVVRLEVREGGLGAEGITAVGRGR